MGQAGNAGTPLITKKIAQITSIIAQYSKIFLLQFPLDKYRLLHLELGLRVKIYHFHQAQGNVFIDLIKDNTQILFYLFEILKQIHLRFSIFF